MKKISEEQKEKYLKKFRISIFNILGYKPLENDSELIEYLNLYRKGIKESIKK